VARGSRSPVGIHMGLSRAAACSRKGENGQAKRHPMAAGSTGPRQEPSLDVWGGWAVRTGWRMERRFDGFRSAALSSAAAANHDPDGLGDDRQVEGQGHVLEVEEIVL
jgi:hypothetical protein